MTKDNQVTACPREAMKAARKDVRDFVEDKAFTNMDHLGEYPTNMTTAKRTIIALQDMLDDSMDHHTRATAYVRELLEEIDMKDTDYASHVQHITAACNMNADTIQMQVETITRMKREYETLEALYYESQSELTEANAIIDEMRGDQDATMRTLRISMED